MGHETSSGEAEGNWYPRKATLMGRRAMPHEAPQDHVDSVPVAAVLKSENAGKDDPVGYRMQSQ